MTVLGAVRCPRCLVTAHPCDISGKAGCCGCRYLYGPWITRALHNPSSTTQDRPHLGRDSQQAPPGATMPRPGPRNEHPYSDSGPAEERDGIPTHDGAHVPHWSDTVDQVMAELQERARTARLEVNHHETSLAVWREQLDALTGAVDALARGRDIVENRADVEDAKAARG